MRKLLKTRSKKIGLPPGSLVPVTDQKPKSARITVIDYDASNLREKTIEDAASYMKKADAISVAAKMVTTDGLFFPVPILCMVSDASAVRCELTAE